MPELKLPESDIRPNHADEFAAILDAAENVVIAHGMGWDMDGVIGKLHDAILDWARKE